MSGICAVLIFYFGKECKWFGVRAWVWIMCDAASVGFREISDWLLDFEELIGVFRRNLIEIPGKYIVFRRNWID